MKMTLHTNQAADMLRADENANWSYSGAIALIEYLENLEEDSGEEIEFDRVAIRCDYSQYDSLQSWAEEYGHEYDKDADEDDQENEIRSRIQDHGTLIEFDGGIIVSSF